MDDQEFFKLVQEDGDKGIVRHVTYPPLPRAKHTFTIVSSKRETGNDGAKFLELIGMVADDSPEKGQSFKVRQMLISKDQKVNPHGKALAAGLYAACKAAGQVLSASFTGAEGVTATGWLDIEISGSGDKEYTNQALHWGETEPPIKVKTSRPNRAVADPAADAPF